MKNTRLITGLVLAGVPGLVSLSVAAPAEATPTRVMPTNSSTPKPSTKTVVIGQELELRGIVNATDTATGIVEPAMAGTVMLQVMSSTSTTWTNVASNGFPNQYHFPDVAPKTNSTYRVVYLGHEPTNPYDDKYLPSESGTVEVGVQRKIKIRTNDLTATAKIGPDYAKKPVTVLQKIGGKYKAIKTFKAVRTDARGKVRFTFSARRAQKVKFAFEVAGDKHYVTTRALGEAVRY